MTTTVHPIPDRPMRIDPARLAVWIFLAATSMLFGAFASAYLVRMASGGWAQIELPRILWLNTGVLVASSVALEMARSRTASSHSRWLALAWAMGAIFLIGQVAAWVVLRDQGVFVRSSPHSSFFYVLTAVHGAHLTGGLAWLAATWSSPRRRSLATTFWHFMGGVWIFVFAVLHLGG